MPKDDTDFDDLSQEDIAAKSAEISLEEMIERRVEPLWARDTRTHRLVPFAIFEERQARTRARNTVNQRKRRERLRAADPVEIHQALADLDMPAVRRPTAQAQANAAQALTDWLALGGRRQQQYRAQEASYLASYLVLVAARAEFGDNPEPAEFAARLTKATGQPFDRHQARHRLRQLVGLEGEDGPWPR